MAKEKKDLTYEDRLKIVTKYHSGDDTLKMQAQEEMIEALDNYIYHLIHRNFAGHMNMIEDLSQSGRMAILEHMGEYNPKYKLTTFFTNHIQNAMQGLVNNENGESHYYAETKNLIIKAMARLNMDFDNIDEQVLAMHLDMTPGRLHSVLDKTIRKKRVELIEESGEVSGSEYFDSPETTFLKAERKKEFRACLNQLDEIEQIVLCMHFGFYHPEFNRDERNFKLNEIQKIFNEKGVQANAINEYRSARRHIGNVMQKHGLAGKKSKYQSAKEEIGLRFENEAAAQELFDALNETTIPSSEVI